MKHLKTVTAAKAASNHTEDINAVLDRIFGFVLDLVDIKGKSAQQPAS